MPIAGADTTAVDIGACGPAGQFRDADAARVWLELRRWPSGAACPHCGNGGVKARKRIGYYRCGACGQDFTVRTGTILHRSHIPPDKWLRAICLFAAARVAGGRGISSVRLAQEISVTQTTAWYLLNQIRALAGEGEGGDGAEAKTVAEVVAHLIARALGECRDRRDVTV